MLNTYKSPLKPNVPVGDSSEKGKRESEKNKKEN